MKPIFLIGFMGCGKTTLGRALQEATGLRLIDLDEFIEQRHGQSISSLFKEHSETGFRQIEHEALAEVCRMHNVIIACGGGTPCFHDNMELMNRSGLTVWLDASPARLLQRLLIARSHRPLIAAMTDSELIQFIHQSLRQRQPVYSRAAASFCADRLDDRQQIDDSVEKFRQRFLANLNNND